MASLRQATASSKMWWSWGSSCTVDALGLLTGFEVVAGRLGGFRGLKGGEGGLGGFRGFCGFRGV